MWLKHDGFDDFLKNFWPIDNKGIIQKIQDLTPVLKTWNQEIFGALFQKKKKRALARLDGIQRALCRRYSPYLWNLEKKVTNEYNNILAKE